jgi:glutamate transport system permease protein
LPRSSQQGRSILEAAFVVGGSYCVTCLILTGIAKWVAISTPWSWRKVQGFAPDGGGVPRTDCGSRVTDLIALQRGTGKFGTDGGSGVGLPAQR